MHERIDTRTWSLRELFCYSRRLAWVRIAYCASDVVLISGIGFAGLDASFHGLHFLANLLAGVGLLFIVTKLGTRFPV